MNGVYCFAIRFFPVVALAILVLAGWPQPAHSQSAGIEPQAEKILRRMGDYLESRQQFTLKAESTLEAVLTSGPEAAVRQPCNTRAVASEQAARSSQG